MKEDVFTSPKERPETSFVVSPVTPILGRTAGEWVGGGEGEDSCESGRGDVRRGSTGGGGGFPGPLPPPAFGALKASEAAATRPIALDISGLEAADATALDVPDVLPGPPAFACAFAAALLCLSPAVMRLAVASGFAASALCTAEVAWFDAGERTDPCVLEASPVPNISGREEKYSSRISKKACLSPDERRVNTIVVGAEDNSVKIVSITPV